MSSSEEVRLIPDDPDDSSSDSSGLNPPGFPVDVTGITMVSPPESQEEEVQHYRSTSLHEDQEIFHTPPESRSTSFDNCLDDRMIGCGFDSEGGNEIVDADSADRRRAVDLGRDTDLGFSEVEVDLSQRIQSNLNPDDMVRTESEEIRVSKRGFSPEEQLSTEYLSKRLKSVDFELPTQPLGTPKVINTNEPLNKRALPSCANIGRVKEITIENEKVSNPCGMEKKSEGKRALPSWANIGRVGDDEELENNETELSSSSNVRAEEDNERADEELNVNERGTIHLDANPDNLNENVQKFPLLDVLMKLEDDVSGLECLSVLEVAQRKWGVAISLDDRS